MSAQEDRRDAKSQRITFDAIVELGGDFDPGTAFEAQGVNLSAQGMLLRTAYLPDLGQQLVCRFGSGAQEIQAEADVVWRKEGTRGGEFGIRFTNIDGVSAAALWEICGLRRDQEEIAAEPDDSRREVDPGTRVRLHIEGLSSPMKARVRGSVGSELLVGSNLEFLRVGRALELENVDEGGKRPAHIDRVDVEVDKESRVPQLVVTLRYDDLSADPPAIEVALPALAATTRNSASVLPTTYVEASSSEESSEPSEEPEEVSPEPSSTEAAVNASTVATPAEERTPEEIEIAKMMRSRFSNAASDMMPKVTALGAQAKIALGLILAKALKRPERDVEVPRRRTSPPPTGALHATGKRVVREGVEKPATDAPEKGIGSRRKGVIAVGAATGVIAVSLVALLSRSSSTAPPGASAQEAEAANVATNIATPPSAAESSATPNGGVEAKVPLFGATTVVPPEALAVTAVAPVTIPPGAAMSPAGRALASNASPALGEVLTERTSQERKIDSDDGKSSKSATKVVPFGHGKVEHATTLRIRTDGAISDLHGIRSAGGFTLTIPGRRALDNGATLASKDPRIAKVSVANGSKGTELTFHFKGNAPAFLVSPSGRELQVALGRTEESQAAKDAARRSTTAHKQEALAPHHHKSDKK